MKLSSSSDRGDRRAGLESREHEHPEVRERAPGSGLESWIKPIDDLTRGDDGDALIGADGQQMLEGAGVRSKYCSFSCFRKEVAAWDARAAGRGGWAW